MYVSRVVHFRLADCISNILVWLLLKIEELQKCLHKIKALTCALLFNEIGNKICFYRCKISKTISNRWTILIYFCLCRISRCFFLIMYTWQSFNETVIFTLGNLNLIIIKENTKDYFSSQVNAFIGWSKSSSEARKTIRFVSSWKAIRSLPKNDKIKSGRLK